MTIDVKISWIKLEKRKKLVNNEEINSRDNEGGRQLLWQN